MPDRPGYVSKLSSPFAAWLARFPHGMRRVLLFGVMVAQYSGAAPTRFDVHADARKVALIVTIGKYHEPSLYGYTQINADNDAPLITQALTSQGFRREDIVVLANERATRQGLIDAFRGHLLEPAQLGDVMVFHYSGHGHQITDDNGDELDGYDEVLVPYGAPNPEGRDFPANYAGEKHIRDDVLNDLLTELRAKVGSTGHVLVTIDACFSGSATRGTYQLPARGVATPIGPPATQRGTSGEVFEASPKTMRGGSASNLAPLVAISATAHDELDREVWGPDHKPVGPLSLAINRTLPNLRIGMSNAAWFDQIRLVMTGLVPV